MRHANVLSFVFLAAFVAIAFTTPSQAAMQSYLKITGSEQNEIKGDSLYAGREGLIVVFSFGHNIHYDRDPNTGLPTAEIKHTPIKILKQFDSASPLLYQALVTGETLEWELGFYRIDGEGSEELYFKITLSGAKIVSITANTPTTFLAENNLYHDMETVSFVYDTITWVNVIDGIIKSANWNSSGP